MDNILLLTIPYFFINESHSEFLPPMHLVYLSNYLKENGIQSEIIDLSADFGIQRDNEEILGFKLKFMNWACQNLSNYNVIGLSCYTSFQYLATIVIAKICKEVAPHAIILVGGYHASALPYDFIFKGSPIDYCVIGEGERAILKIIKALKNGVSINPIVKEKPIIDINKYCKIDYTLLKEWDKYTYHYDYLSRGCPYVCTFCMESVKTERRWRNLTIENALCKIDSAVNHVSKMKLKNQKLHLLNLAR